MSVRKLVRTYTGIKCTKYIKFCLFYLYTLIAN
jgi:hypothetical protein